MSKLHLRDAYISRTEGEAAYDIRFAKDGTVTAKLDVWEPPRFFEGFLVGRHCTEAPDITSRICGICPVSHMLTSVQAVEAAVGIAPSPETIALRRLLDLSQTAASHAVHLYMLAWPDAVRQSGFPGAAAGDPEAAARLLRMKATLNDLGDLIGGRALHPVTVLTGGFSDVPPVGRLRGFGPRLRELLPDAVETVRMVAAMQLPELPCERTLAALIDEAAYPALCGDIGTSQGLRLGQEEHQRVFIEYRHEGMNAKRALLKEGGACRSGSLARLVLNAPRLRPAAAAVLRELRLPDAGADPFRNNLAQAVELVSHVEECSELAESIELGRVDGPVRPAAGRHGTGASLTEAPRGLLRHEYSIDREGIITNADIITPTVHNLEAMEQDLAELAGRMRSADKAELKWACGSLVRSYDPCFSCSVH